MAPAYVSLGVVMVVPVTVKSKSSFVFPAIVSPGHGCRAIVLWPALERGWTLKAGITWDRHAMGERREGSVVREKRLL